MKYYYMIIYIYFFTIFNYFIISLLLNIVYYKITSEFNLFLTNLLYNSIELNGCILIKFTQWFLTRYELYIEVDNFPKELLKFKNFYEKCSIHSFEYTNKIMNTEMKNKNFKITNNIPIASGSIAQIYKGVDLNNNNDIVIKIIHPYIKEQLYFPILFINTIEYLSKYNIFNKIPFKLNDFIKILKEQTNLNKEFHNLAIFNNNFKDNSLVIFPKPYFSSQNILVMSYEDGISFNDIQLSDYEKYKIIMTFVLAIRQMCLIDNFIHGDLHIGNWKVVNNNNKYKTIIILDCGIAIKPENNNIIYDWFNAWENNDICQLNNIIIKQIEFKEDNKNNKHLVYLVTKLLKDNYEHAKPLNINYLIIKLYNFLIEHNLYLNDNLLNMIIIMSLIEKNLNKFHFTGDERIKDKKINLEDCYRKQYLDYIAFCNTTNEFNKLKLLTIDRLNKSNIKYNNLFDNIEDKLNYSDINIDNKEKECNNEIELSF